MRLALLLLVLLARDANPAPLDEALSLALARSAPVAAAQAEAQAVGRQRAWSAKIDFKRVLLAPTVSSSSSSSSDSGKAGDMSASFTLEIPLFSRKQDLDAAQARAKLALEEEQTRKALLAEVTKLEELTAKTGEGAEMARFYRDRVAYFKQAEQAGRIAPELLWDHAEKAKRAEHDATQARIKLAAGMEETARRFGGEEWNALQALLAAHLKQSGH